MRKLTFIVVAVTLLASACGEKSADKSILLSGNSYYGLLPSASCSGIETSLMFDNDTVVTREVLCVDEDLVPMIDAGKYSVKDSVVSIVFADSTTNQKYRIMSDGRLSLLGSDGNMAEGELVENYKLAKVDQVNADVFEGTFKNGEDIKGAYRDVLTINTIGQDSCSVAFSSEGAGKGCSFNGKGVLKGDRIVVNLSDYEKSLQSKMIITVRDGVATVYTDDPEKRLDLSFFCGGGGSLIGRYKKTNK